MAVAVIPFRPAGAAAGTTDGDLMAAGRFAFGRPGWGVEVRRTGPGEEAHLVLRTPSAGPRDGHRWRIVRTYTVLAVVNVAAGEYFGRFGTMREALTAVWEVEARAVPAD